MPSIKRGALVFYVSSLRDGVAGEARGPVVRILEIYRGDRGLLEHELVHVRQFWTRLLVVHSLAYLFSRRYRFAAEVEAYREQARWYPDDRLPLFARFIAERYRLSVSAEEALAALGPRFKGEEPQ